MESELDLKKIQDEVFRKIGKNILNFQKIEGMLKYIIANSYVEGYRSEIEENHKKQSALINKQTMGQLTGKFLGNTLIKSGDSNQAPNEQEQEQEQEREQERDEAYCTYSYTIGTDSDSYDKKGKN